jgi:hypothetical protein
MRVSDLFDDEAALQEWAAKAGLSRSRVLPVLCAFIRDFEAYGEVVDPSQLPTWARYQTQRLQDAVGDLNAAKVATRAREADAAATNTRLGNALAMSDVMHCWWFIYLVGRHTTLRPKRPTSYENMTLAEAVVAALESGDLVGPPNQGTDPGSNVVQLQQR